MVYILILNWNNAPDTSDCLKSLQLQTEGDFNVLVLDNGSEPSDLADLQTRFPADERFRLVASSENLGFARGVNYLLQEYVLNSYCEFVALLNNDATVNPQWLEQLLAKARESDAGMVASCMVNFFDRSRMDNAGHIVLNTGEVLPLGQDEPVADLQQSLSNVGACAGAALYRTDMLRRIGLFDPFFFTGYEDAELGVRAVLTGYTTVYAPKAIAYHKISRSINKVRDFNYTLKVQVDAFYTVLKLWPWPNLLLNAPFFILKVGLVSVMNLLFGRWAYMRMLWMGLYRILIKERSIVLRSRRAFYAQTRPGLTWYEFQQKLTFFLSYDLQRFYKYIWKREKAASEKY